MNSNSELRHKLANLACACEAAIYLSSSLSSSLSSWKHPDLRGKAYLRMSDASYAKVTIDPTKSAIVALISLNGINEH